MARPTKSAPGLGTRLVEMRGEATREEFASLLGVHPNTIGNYERGDRQPDPEFFGLLRERAGADINWLITGEGKDEATHAVRGQTPGQVTIPRYAIQTSAGCGSIVISEDVEDHFTVSRGWLSRFLPKGAKAGIIEARGDSMEPTIADGDILILNFSIDSSTVNDDGVFVISVDGTLLVKRLQVTVDGHILIRSDNDLYEQEKVTREFADERITVHAKVVWAGGPVRRR